MHILAQFRPFKNIHIPTEEINQQPKIKFEYRVINKAFGSVWAYFFKFKHRNNSKKQK
jgi:hypothetical protein